MAETLIILGWTVNTRSLTIALPSKKFQLWSTDINKVLLKRKTSTSTLETIIGRLNHTATACPIMRYYLNCIRHLLESWKCDETLDPLLDQGLVEVRGRCCYLLLLLKR